VLDPVKVEAAEASIDRFIEQRSRQRNQANALAEAWAASECRHREKLRQENRWEWIRFYETLAHNHAQLADENRAKAEALLEGEGGLSLMARCAGFKPTGEPCERIVPSSQSYCYSHDPERQEERRRNASKAGKGGGSAEIRDLKKKLEDLARDVLEGRVDRGDAVAVNQILNTRARLIELDRKIKETDEIEARIEALEQGQQRRGGSRWGA